MQKDFTRADRHYRREALAWTAVFVALVPVLLFLVPNFRLFPYERHGEMVIVHLLAELVAIGVSLLVAVMAWHTLDRERLASSNLVLFGFTVVAGIDLVHALTYDGMPDFLLQPSTPMAIVFWLVGRLAAALVLAAIALDLRVSRSRGAWLLAAGVVVCGVTAAGPWLLGHMPALFVPGLGVTAFKGKLEYGLCGLYVVVAVLLWWRAERRGQPWLLPLAAGSLISGVGEILFTSYITPSDVQNVAGHAFKVATFVLIYRGMYITALQSPYARLEGMQARLVEQESILRAVVNSIPFEVWVRDSEGRVIIENPAVVAHWGKLVGTSDSDPALPPETRKRWIAKRERAMRGETLFEQIRLFVDGLPRDFQNVVAPVLSDGRIVGSVGLNIDITERVLAEREIRHLNAELERRVDHRTRELQLANDELEEFTASVSHDLQAPLRNIAGYIGMLQEADRAAGDEAARAIAAIGKETQRAQGLIRDLLKLARVGRTGLDRSAVDLAALVREVIATLKVQAPGRDVQWQVDALPILRVDPGLFRQVFENLLGNALKFTSGRSPARIRVSADADTAGNCVICVEDNGAGFEARLVGNLFRAFRRLHPEALFQGTGIGLANVRRIVEHHGGRVWAEGSPNRGARFFVSLPYDSLDRTGTV